MNVCLRFVAVFVAAMVALFSADPANAQSATSILTGSIVDRKTALPISGATVVLSRAGKRVESVRTDSAGHFILIGVAPGIYDLAVSARGYAPVVSSDVVAIGGATVTLNSALSAAEENGGNLRTIGNVSTSANVTLSAATTISQSVSVDDLLRTGQSRVYDRLGTLPAINASTSSSPGDDSSINIRGFGRSETATLLGGHPVGPLGVQAPDGFNFSATPTFGLSSVTVTYGSGAQGLYGSDTVAGAVDFESISPTSKPELNFLQSAGGFGNASTGLAATGTYGKVGYALAAAVQGTSGSFNGAQVFQSARPANINSASIIPNGACNNNNGNDVSACDQAQETYAVGQDTKLTSEIAKLRYTFSPVTAFQTSFYSGTLWADSTGNGDNDNLPYASRLAQITTNQISDCTLVGGGNGYTVVTNPIANTTSCYSAPQWAAVSSGPNGGGTGRDRSTSMRDYDVRFTTEAGKNNITLDSYINNYWFWKNSVQSGGATAAGGFIGTPDFTDFFNTRGYLISDDIANAKNDFGFGYSLINQLQTSTGVAGNGPIDPSTGINSLVNIPNYNFPASYFSEGSVFVRDSYRFNDLFSLFANSWIKRSSVTQKTSFDPRITALVHATNNDVFRLTYGRSDGAPAPLLKAVGITQVTDPGNSLTSVSCNGAANSVATAGNPNLTSENAVDIEAGYGHRFKEDSNFQVNAYVTNLKDQLIGATEPILQYGLGNVNFQGGALTTYIARLNANGCLGRGVTPLNVDQFLGVSTTYNLGNQLARGIEISGRERVNRILYLDYSYSIESSQSFNIPDSVLVNNANQFNGVQVAAIPLHQGTISVDIAPGPWDFRIDNYYTEQNNPLDRPSYWHSDVFLTRSFNGGKTLLTLGGTNIFNQASQVYGYIGAGTFTAYNPIYAAANGVNAANGLQELANGISSNEEFGIPPAQLTLTLTQRL
jgi:outer membrane receptor protein involved in Fe transport